MKIGITISFICLVHHRNQNQIWIIREDKNWVSRDGTWIELFQSNSWYLGHTFRNPILLNKICLIYLSTIVLQRQRQWSDVVWEVRKRQSTTIGVTDKGGHAKEHESAQKCKTKASKKRERERDFLPTTQGQRCCHAKTMAMGMQILSGYWNTPGQMSKLLS